MENDKTFELITKMYTELTTKIDTMNTELTTRMDNMNTELTTRMDNIQNDVTTLKTDVATLKTDVKNLETKMDQRFDSLILGIADLVTKDIAEQISTKIDDLERSLAVVELVSSKNMSDIATLKLAR